jgi:hypothetical protein
MSVQFDPHGRAVVVPVLVAGLVRTHVFRFVVDTGTNLTSMRVDLLRLLGFDPATSPQSRRLRSATSTVRVPVLIVPRLASLGQTRSDFEIAAHDPPAAFSADGLLGLDFYRDLCLTIDFHCGRISLNPHGKWWQFWR